MTAYLFTHFTGEQPDGEQVSFALGRDGLHYQDLNGGRPILRSSIGRGGVRDPFPVRHPKTGRVYLLATDECIGSGRTWEQAQYEGCCSLVLWYSDDLVHWEGPFSRTVGVPESGCVWAPEAIWDEEQERFLVYWASMTGGTNGTEQKHRIYAAWTEDFSAFSEPFCYIERDCDIIDTTILRENGQYYRFSKDERSKHLLLERGDDLVGTFAEIFSPVLQALRLMW